MKQVLELQPFIPNANQLNIWQLYNLNHWLKKVTYQSTNLFPQWTPNCGSSCEKVTGSNVINVLKGGCAHTGAKAFLLITDNRRSRLDSPICLITQSRKFECGHHRQSKKINAQELTMQLSQTLSSAIAQIKQLNYTSHKIDLAPAPPSFFQFLYYLKINFFVDCFSGGGLSSSVFFFFFFFFFAFGCCCCWRKILRVLIDVFPL